MILTRIAIETINWLKGQVEAIQRNEITPFPYFANQGGTSAGKTVGILYGFFLFLTTEINPETGKLYEFKIGICGVNLKHLKNGAMQDLENILSAHYPNWEAGRNKQDYSYNVGLSTFHFLAMDTNKSLGVKWDIILINEANKSASYDIAEALKMRSMYGVAMDWNPTSAFWFHAKIRNKTLYPEIYERVKFCRWTYEHNPTISEDRKHTLMSYATTDPEKYRVYTLGLTGNQSGQVFKNVDWVRYMPTEYDIEVYGLDWGGRSAENDPTAICRVCFVQNAELKEGVFGGAIFCQEIYYGHGGYSEIADVLFESNGNDKVYVVCDHNTQMQTELQIRLKELYRGKSGRITLAKAEKQAGSIADGINFVNDFGRVFITADSTNWRKESENYIYKENSAGKNLPIDKYNHLWDALRYAVMSEEFMNRYKKLLKRNLQTKF